jgi:CDP-diacylglycerol--glycerol-3-phosphate 3-phosphatidyltransferase
MREQGQFFLIMLGLEATTYAVSFLRFRKEPCTHAYSAKTWSVILVTTFAVMLAFGEKEYSAPILFWTYLVSWIDVVAILLILPRWQSDIPSCYHAWLIRKGRPFRTFKAFH